jgi:hypothetical protein
MKSSIKRRAAQQSDTDAHTPGPWKVVPSPHGDKYRCVQYGKDDAYTSLEMLPADARLCAAAPDLLAALKLAERWLANCTPVVDLDGPKPLPIVSAAIAKAEGSRRNDGK